MSADGKISSVERRQLKISGPQDRIRVDELRASSDAIMVGVGTILADDPGLRIRSDTLRRERLDRGESSDPLRIVADSTARTPQDAQVLGDGCIIAVSRAAAPQMLIRLQSRCRIVVYGEDRVDLVGLMEYLDDCGVKRVMVEGGGVLNWGMIEAGLVDEIYIYHGNMLIGGNAAPSPLDGAGFIGNYPSLELVSLDRLNGGALVRWRVKKK